MQKQNRKMIWEYLLYMSPSGNQVDCLPVAQSWLRSGRAAKRKIYKKMYTVDIVIVEKSIVNYRKVGSYHNKASMEGI